MVKDRSSQETTYFDPDGDLNLHVGPDAMTYVVCSRSLSRASQVFKKMLYGGFAESKPAQGDWNVQLPDDDPAGLRILFSIIHGTFDRVPKMVEKSLLYQITVLTDKYDLVSVLQPWSARWIQPSIDAGAAASTPQRVWIAWELARRSCLGSRWT
jgi:hypothetical protein